MTASPTDQRAGTLPVDGCCPGGAEAALSPDAAETLARALKALADPTRLRMLSHLVGAERGEACVCDLAELTDLSQPTVSHHLKVLRREGVVQSERRGTWVWYRLSTGMRQPVTQLLEHFAPAVLAGATDGAPASEASDGCDLDHVVDTLLPTFPRLSPDLVRSVVTDSHEGLSRSFGRHPRLLPLTERFARQRLDDVGRDRTSTPPQVLFVCVANAGRSQLAASLVRRYAGDRVVVRSAGSTPARSLHANVARLMTRLGDDTGDAFPKPLTEDAVRAADVVVTLGCGDVCPVVPGVRYEEWSVADPALASRASFAAIHQDLDRRVRGLLADLLLDLDLPTD